MTLSAVVSYVIVSDNLVYQERRHWNEDNVEATLLFKRYTWLQHHQLVYIDNEEGKLTEQQKATLGDAMAVKDGNPLTRCSMGCPRNETTNHKTWCTFLLNASWRILLYDYFIYKSRAVCFIKHEQMVLVEKSVYVIWHMQ